MKNRFFAKLKSRAGETLVETLFAILIATFASILLAGATTTAMELNRQARERDRVNQICLEKLAKQENVKVEENKLNVFTMEMNEEGKLEKKTDDEDVPLCVSVQAYYSGCEVSEATLGDFSTYALENVLADEDEEDEG